MAILHIKDNLFRNRLCPTRHRHAHTEMSFLPREKGKQTISVEWILKKRQGHTFVLRYRSM